MENPWNYNFNRSMNYNDPFFVAMLDSRVNMFRWTQCFMVDQFFLSKSRWPWGIPLFLQVYVWTKNTYIIFSVILYSPSWWFDTPLFLAFFHSNIQLQVVPLHSLSGSLMMGNGDGFYDDGLYYDDDDGCIMLCHFCVSFPVQLAGICCLNPPAKRCSKWLK